MRGKKKTTRREIERVGVLVAHADRLSGRILSVTSPVYTPDTKGNPSFLGSAVFLEIGPARFVLSAAHVMDHRHAQNLYLHGKDGLVLLRGDFTRLFRAGPVPEDDGIDISIVRLQDETADDIRPDSFLTWRELDHSISRITRDTFFTVGFPVSKQRDALQGNELRAAAFRMAGMESLESAYRSVGLDPRSSLLIGFDKKKMWDTNGKVTAPDLNGMSGGGVWRAGRRLPSVSTAPLLSAILIEARQKVNPKHILATRIQPILGTIASQYPDVAGIMDLLP